MKTQNGAVKLYNIIFPVFLLMLLVPMMWLIMLAGNFVIDSLVLCLAFSLQKIPEILSVWKRSILKTFLFGFLSDWIGALVTTILFMYVMPAFSLDNVNPYDWPGCAWMAIPAIVIAAVLIYFFNARWAFSKTALTPAQKKRTALYLAILTAPYAMIIPMPVWNSLF